MRDVVSLIKEIQKREKLAKKERSEIPRSELEEISGGIDISSQKVNITVVASGDHSRVIENSNVIVRRSKD